MTWRKDYVPHYKSFANAFDAVPEGNPKTAYQIFLGQQKPRMRLDYLKNMLDYWASIGKVESLRIGGKVYYRKPAKSLASESVASYTTEQRSTDSLDANVDWFYQALSPLRRGQPVFLTMDGRRVVPRKGPVAEAKRMVILTPGALLGVNPKAVLVAVLGLGSCVVRADQPAKVANLVLAGLPASLANLLMNTVHHVLKE